MIYFSTKTPYLGKFFEGLAMDDVGKFLWLFGIPILRPFGIF
jgi:hypothetical protein